MNFYQNNILSKLKIPILIIIDIFLCNLSLVISYSLRLEKFYMIYEIDKEILLYFNFIFLLIFFYYRFYNIVLRFFSVFNIKKIIQYFLIYLILIIVFAVITYNKFYLPRSIILLHSFIFFIFILSVRIFYSYFVNLKKNISYNNVVLILGVNQVSINLSKNIVEFTNNKIIGFIEEKKDFNSREINGIKIYNINSLENLIFKFKVTDLLVTKEKLNSKENSIINKLRKNSTVRILNIHKYDFYIPNLLRNSNNNVDLNFSDVIQREEISPGKELLAKVIQNKTILITGSGGSIGSELCIQIVNLKPKHLILMDNSELNLYNLQKNLNYKKNTLLEFILGDCSDPIILDKIFKKVKIDIIYHAAAYKHVNILESNIVVSFKNNALSTYYLCDKSIKYNVKNFILISTDKAVNPKSVLGFSKRISEKIVLAFSKYKSQTNFSYVRFGNVIGSSGSVIPLFKRQIISGGPVTVTSKKVSRYFMSISEAVVLILQSTGIAKTGDNFVLDMGSQINIYDIAVRMINLMGYSLKNQKNPNGDIEIKIIGLKRGEKLAEQLYLGSKKSILIESKKFKKTNIKGLFLCIEEKEIDQKYIFKIKKYLNKYNLIKTKRDLQKLL